MIPPLFSHTTRFPTVDQALAAVVMYPGWDCVDFLCTAAVYDRVLIGNRRLMIVAGPVNIWNTTRHSPPSADLAGYYRLVEGAGRDISPRAGFRLTADHRSKSLKS